MDPLSLCKLTEDISLVSKSELHWMQDVTCTFSQLCFKGRSGLWWWGPNVMSFNGARNPWVVPQILRVLGHKKSYILETGAMKRRTDKT